MTLTQRSTLRDVAGVVAMALERAGIRAVLTGGACASIHTRAAYQSADLDFVLEGRVTRAQLDAAMATAGFSRDHDQYVHPQARFFVEFLRGPLAIGEDFEIQPVEYRIRRHAVWMLSSTDSCRDRLAAFYFWNDRQSLRAAVLIALRHPIDIEAVQRWSTSEGHASRFDEFVQELERARPDS